MRCRACNCKGAYEGLQWIHCQNQVCRYYDAEYTEKVRREQANTKFYNTVEKLSAIQEERDRKG